MILKIVGFGHPALRRENEDLPQDYSNLGELIASMYETMYNAHGVGLAAPQVDVPYRIFVVDGHPMQEMAEEGESMEGFKKVFINPEILEESGTEWSFEEGCLSIPDIREPVWRKPRLTLRYLDENLEEAETPV